jgi:hybrid cluster-associated redox disulfide protein
LRKRKDFALQSRDSRCMTADTLLNTLVSDVLAAHPGTARVFIEQRMGCVACAFAPFETVADVARVYGIDPWHLASSLASAATFIEEIRQ